MGRPCPPASLRSASLAMSSASSGVTVTYECTFSSTASMRFKKASVISTELAFFSRENPAQLCSSHFVEICQRLIPRSDG